MKIPRFLLCNNPMVDSNTKFLLSTRKPKALFIIIPSQNSFSLELYELYQGTDKEVSQAVSRAQSWYISTFSQ